MKSALYITPKLPYPPHDGGRIVSWNLARALRHNGYEVDLATFVGDEGAIERHRSALAPVFRATEGVVRDVQRQYPFALVRALVTGGSYFCRKFRSAELERTIERMLRAHRYDVAILETAYMGLYEEVLRRVPERVGHTILRLQNIEYEIFERLARYERNPLYRALLRREAEKFRRFEAESFRDVEDVRAITERDAEHGERVSGQPVGFLAATIDCDRYSLGEVGEIEPESVVTIGDLAWPPNRNGVLWFHANVWRHVVERRPGARLYIVGANPPSAVRELAGPNVEVTGFVSDDAAYFRRAQLFAVPLLEGSGVRIKILTALAQGKRVLSTTVGAEGIPYPGLRRADEPEAWIEEIDRAFGAPPTIDAEARTYVQNHHHWAREIAFEPEAR